MLTNGGKTNAPHQLQYSGMVPHKNALLCPITAKGVVFVHRFMVLGEALPDLTAPDEFMRFPTLRAASGPHAPLAYRHCADQLQQLYSHCDVLCAKVTHQERAQGQRNLDDGGVSRDAIARMAHYDHTKQAESYLCSLQPFSLAVAAGMVAPGRVAEPAQMFGFVRAHDQPVCDDLIYSLVPPLRALRAAHDDRGEDRAVLRRAS